MSEIPTKTNVELMKETFPQKDEPAPDPEAGRDAANEGAFELMDKKTTYSNEYWK
jgi:hypothetical protein